MNYPIQTTIFGNSINYSISNERNDKPEQGYENTVLEAGIGTSFEQYRDVTASLGLNASYDDLRTTNNASTSLKKQSGTFNELSVATDLHLIKETEFYANKWIYSKFQTNITNLCR